MSVKVNDGYETWTDKKGHAVSREFETATLHDGTEVEAHTVTKDTEGEVNTVGNDVRSVSEGDVIVRTDRPGTYDVYSADAFGELCGPYKAPRKAGDEESPEYFEPSDHTAREVREFLLRDDVSDEDKERVRQAESEGRNRATAFPRE
jgi:hypothetical protein